MADATVRPVREGEIEAFLAVQRTSMLYPPPTERDLEIRREAGFDESRSLVALDEGDIVGSTRCFATTLTTPGGAVPAAAVTSVGVLPTHRRRGHLTRLMDRQLGDTVERGEQAAMLVSAEWPIYGRYGYGVATEACVVALDLVAAGFVAPPAGRAALVDAKTYREAVADVYPRAAAATPGHMSWEDRYYELWSGEREVYDGHAAEQRNALKVVWRDDDGLPQGAARYTVKQDWVDNRPRGQATVDQFAAATPQAELELYRYLTAIDWAATAEVHLRPIDDPLPFSVADGRAAKLRDRSDHIWLRILDVPGTLSARTYATEGSLVVEVVDPMGHAAGRFALDAGPDGGTCLPTDLSPDITVPAGVLGAAYLGGQPWSRLAAAGLVDEHRSGAVTRATTLFGAPRAPYCSTPF